MPRDHSLSDAVARAMREAADRAILPRYRPGAPIAADYKAPGEAVTAADRECEAILAGRLAAILPGVRIVGEEAAHDDPLLLADIAEGSVWVIDPLDGTANFAAGTPPFGVMVALCEQGVPVGGWILDPLTGRLCAALDGAGAHIDGMPIDVSHAAAPAPAARPKVAVTSLFARDAERAAVMATLAERCDVRDAPRCAAENYPAIALGVLDAAVFTRVLAWDHAAGVCLVNAAGGRAARPDGTAWRCGDDGSGLIAAADARTWDAVAQAVASSGVALAGAWL